MQMTIIKAFSKHLLLPAAFVMLSTGAFAGTPPQIAGAEYYYGQNSLGSQVMCVIQQHDQKAGKASFSVWNDMPVPISVVFTPQLENMKADKTMPLSIVVDANATVAAYSAARKERSRSYRWQNNWNWKIGSIEARHDDRILYRLPFPDGRQFPVVQGYNGSFSHFGEFAFSIDWDMPNGTPVLAARDGIVAHVQHSFTGFSSDPAWKERTNQILIFHDDGTMAEYSHISQNSAVVKSGDRVKAGRQIALSGDVGYSTSPHLHFRVFRLKNAPVSPVEESIPVTFRGADGKKLHPGR